jgi:NAD(P)-dependent dehydrogenase (short-subunit alcohol dehydrogenase family)
MSEPLPGQRLAGRVAVVTGGGRGIGTAYAERFLAEGARVVIAEIDAASGEAAAAGLGTPDVVRSVRTDVTDPESARACVAAACEAFGTVDILVNNAGLYGDWDMGDQSLEYLRRMFDVNLHGSWVMARAVAPVMTAQRRGRIVNVASGAAYNYSAPARAEEFRDLPSFNYSQSKWGVVGLTKYLAGYLGQWGITVNCLAPGVIASEATLRQIPADLLDRLAQIQPIAGRIEPADVAGAAVFFAGDDARFVTGQVIVIDGGRHMPA